MQARWILPSPVSETARSLADQIDIAPFLAELLCRRGLESPEQAADFLDPKLKTLRDPLELHQMRAAVERTLQAIDQREKVVLYGDYDVDGVTSLAILCRVLRACGADVECFLPSRIEEGYGLTADGVARCLQTLHPQLLIAVDCGTSSAAEIAQLHADGVDVVVLDHHECKTQLPACIALVNPKLGGDGRDFCSAGLAFKFAHALLKLRPQPGLDLRHYLDLVAVGTVADLVPLTGENRILVRRGLQQIAQSCWPGLAELVAVSGMRIPVDTAGVGFGIGPRLNAAGRLGTAQDALELLLTDDPGRARQIAAGLDQQNRERRTVEQTVLEQAEAQLATWFNPEEHAAIVVGDTGWHPGVVGIVASRISRRHHRPTFVVGFDEHGVGKGSGRSIEGLSLVKSLDTIHKERPLLERFGGHEMAAGITLMKEHLDPFREALLKHAGSQLGREQLQPTLRIDGSLALAEVDLDLLRQHDALHPFGMGNSQPLFMARNVSLSEEPRIMKEKHFSLSLQQGHRQQRAVWFGGAEQPLPKLPWDIAFHVERNVYKDRVSAQIQIRAVRTATP